MGSSSKTRLEARVTSQQKSMFVRAATAAGMSLSDFVKSALLEKTNRTLQDINIIHLCQKDQEQLAQHLLNPPKTPTKFKKFMAWCEQQEDHAETR